MHAQTPYGNLLIVFFFWYFHRKLGIWLSLGGFHERGEGWETDRRIYNSHIIINDMGNHFPCTYRISM